MHRLWLLAILALAACSTTAPETVVSLPPALDLPASVAAPPDSLADRPVMFPFDGRAGQVVHLRARTVSGPTALLCLTSAEAWERYSVGEDPDAGDSTDLAGGGFACDPSADDAEGSELLEILPRTGRYVVLVANGRGTAPGAFQLEVVEGDPEVTMMPASMSVAHQLGADPAWGTDGSVGVHFIEGRAGGRLDVAVASSAFQPYVEIGAWVGDAYTPILGTGAQGADSARVSLPLAADGVYTVRVTSLDGGEGGYTLRASARPPEAWSARFPGGGDPSERYALIVAVSDYPGIGLDQSDDLIGPRADGEAVREMLVGTFGLRPENVLVLRDAEATREAVIEAFQRHLGQAGPGGTAYFHYSGHGTQLPVDALPGADRAEARAEADGLDEALVLWDRGGDVSFLLDHELGALAEGLAAEYALLTLDNCHSGDGSRQVGEQTVDAAVRLLPYDNLASRLRTPARLLSDGSNVGAEHHVLLSAARAEQPSLELDGLAPDGGRAGVFTSALVEALREAAPDDTFEDVLLRVRPLVERRTRRVMERFGYLAQQPQVEGAQADVRIADALRR